MRDRTNQDIAQGIEAVKTGTVPAWVVLLFVLGPGSVAGLIGAGASKGALENAGSDIAGTVRTAVANATVVMERRSTSNTAKLDELAAQLREQEHKFTAYAARCQEDRAAYAELVRQGQETMKGMREQIRDINHALRQHMDYVRPKGAQRAKPSPPATAS